MPKKQKLVEVARSFSYKLNAGNFESRDFFCSQKAEIPEEEAIKKSEELYDFCRNEVEKSVNKYLAEKLVVNQKEAKIQNETPVDWHDKIGGETEIEKQERYVKEEEERRQQLEAKDAENKLPIINQ